MTGRPDQANQLRGTVSVAEILHYLDQDRYLTLAEATKYLSLSERSLRKLLPEIKHFRVHSKLLFRKSDLDHWMERYIEDDPGLRLDCLAREALEGIADWKVTVN